MRKTIIVDLDGTLADHANSKRHLMPGHLFVLIHASGEGQGGDALSDSLAEAE